MKQAEIHLAVFISSHGYGHAARISAVMTALLEIHPNLVFEVFTEVPYWFLTDSLPPAAFNYYPTRTDIGMAQKSPLREDIPRTLEKLKHFIPFEEKSLSGLVARLNKMDCRLVLCDIAPLGIAVARKASLPSVLVENFTWDWIYEGYPAYRRDFTPFITYLRTIFESADHHIQAQPVCHNRETALRVNPISRPPQQDRPTTRKKLGLPEDARVVLVTLGGIPTLHHYMQDLKKYRDIFFILPIDVPAMKREDNCLILPHHSDFYHPDLVAASDAVIGKLGYSTLAEVFHAGIPFGFIARDQFRESLALAEFAREHMPGIGIHQKEFEAGTWVGKIADLASIERIPREEENGAGQAARIIHDILI